MKFKYCMISLLLLVLFLSPGAFAQTRQLHEEALLDTLRETYAEAYETEKHVHTYHRTFARKALPTGTSKADTTAGVFYPFDLTAASDSTFGTAVQILGEDDTPMITGMKWFDLHEVIVVGANSNSVYCLRILIGATAAAALASGDYTDTWFYGDDANPNQASPIEFEINVKRHPVGSKAWAQLSNAAGAQTASFLFASHEYPR